MKKVIICIFLFILFSLIPNKTNALESITLVNEISPITNPTNLKIDYLVMPATENEDGVSGEIDELEVDFTGCSVQNYKIRKEVELDFSKVEYTKPGVYRYIVRQKRLSDTKTFIKSTQIYYIYVDVSKDDEGNNTIEVLDLVYDTEKQEKGDLIFNNETIFTHFEIENKVDGSMREQDREVYFKYKLVIKGEVNHQYNIIGQDKAVYYNGHYIGTDNTYTVKEGEDNYLYIYLKDGQKVSIGMIVEQIPYNVESSMDGESYSIGGDSLTKDIIIEQIPIDTEMIVYKVDGEKWLTLMNGEEKISKSLIAKDDNNYLLIVNKRDFDSAITGAIYNNYPFVLVIIIICSGGIIFIKNKNIKKEDNK